MLKKYYFFLLVPGFWLLTLNPCCAQDTRSLFKTANTYYQNKQYEEAAHFYLQVLQQDRNNVNACFNLGNTYYHLHHFPEAILYYEKAAKLQPDNKYVKQNLALTNNKLFTKLEFSKEFFVTQYSKNFFNGHSSNQWARWMLIALWTGTICLLIYFARRSSAFRTAGMITMALSVFFAIATWSRYRQEREAGYAVIFSDKTPLLQTPVDASRVVDSIQAGMKVKLTDHDGKWAKIELPNGKQGWIRNDSFEQI